jgi:catechol 2,3-dioxygenase-like lactoylglutathione lyase family enzyme
MTETPHTPIAMKTSGVHHLAIRSTDLERSKRFYVETLGFELRFEGPHMFVPRAGETRIGVRGPEAMTPEGDVFSPFRAGLDHVALACDDEAELERVAGALTAAGIENTGIKTSRTGNRCVGFWDPDRIKWEFYME